MKLNQFIVLLGLIVSNALSIKSKSRLRNKSKDDGETAAIKSSEAVPQEVTYEGYFRIAFNQMDDDDKFPIIEGQSIQSFKNITAADLAALKDKGLESRINSIKNSQFGSNEKVETFDSFFLRIQGNKVTLHETDEDTVALVQIHPSKFLTEKDIDEQGCVEVDDKDEQWLVCNTDAGALKEFSCAIHKILGEECESEDAAPAGPKKKILQPLMIIPLPSPDCAVDWNYNMHGQDWVCRCNEGLEQSPINLPNANAAGELDYNAEFEYNNVDPLQVKVIFENNMVRIKGKKPKTTMVFGKITDVDGIEYHSNEIQIHTPAEHQIEGKYFDMEIQVIHEAQSGGSMKNAAILSFIIEDTPGQNIAELNNWDLLNLPNPGIPEVFSFFQKSINVWKFMYGEDNYNENLPFSYWKYMGSKTSPPCEENVVWFIYGEPIPQGSTAISMIRDALNPPGKTPHDKMPNYDGSNRDLQPLRKRRVFYYDRTKGCSPYKSPNGDFKGHWEKLQDTQESYIYLGGDKPSGIPNSQVVSESEANSPLLDKIRKYDRYELNKN